VIVDRTGIRVVDMKTGNDKLLVENQNVSAFEISPRDTYLVTCEKLFEGQKNLKVWDL
jgi:hypothetical protein